MNVTNSLQRLFFLSVLWCGSLLPQPLFGVDINALDMDFQKLSAEIYQHYTKAYKDQITQIEDISVLVEKVRQLTREKQHFHAISHITANINTIKKHIDNEALFDFVSLLLKHNEWYTAKDLLIHAKSTTDDYVVSRLNFLFAKYYFSRKQVEKSLQMLKVADVYSDLPEDDTHYGLIMNGVALQYIKKHRQAEKFYAQVPEQSKYYLHAQLNLAIINIRQGWWTDAHAIINKLLNDEDLDKSDEMVNRLYVVLAYSMLHNEFYRDAREVFRNIGIDSQYANQALLGIALSAANQGDYIGALNALNTLREKTTLDLYVDESYVLLPYVYEKLGQQLTASSSYSETIEYYQKRIGDINKLMDKSRQIIAKNKFIRHKTTISLENQSFDFNEKYPVDFLNNRTELKQFREHISDTQLLKKIDELSWQYDEMLNNLVTIFMQERIKYLNSYLNQSRYGLARLYDKE